MTGDLLSIASSGTRAARAAIDLTAQNIANADTQGYVRRTLDRAELTATEGPGGTKGALSGVRIVGTARAVDTLRQADMRRTASDAARSAVQLQALQDIEGAIADAQPFEGVVAFEASLRRLAIDPRNEALHIAATGAAETMAASFNLAAARLEEIDDAARTALEIGSGEVATAALSLAKLNSVLVRVPTGSDGHAALLDQRDVLLGTIAQQVGVHIALNEDGQAEVRVGSADGAVLVTGVTAAQFETGTDANGRPIFTVDGLPVEPTAGQLAGHVGTMQAVADARGDLDAAADRITELVNTAQASGVTPAGDPGTDVLAGSGAAGIHVLPKTGAHFATDAPDGGDGVNLRELVTAFETEGAAQAVGDLALRISVRVSEHGTTHDALEAIAAGARALVDKQSGVNLDTEAADLVRFQQAFQASGRVMQVATTLFDTLLGVGR